MNVNHAYGVYANEREKNRNTHTRKVAHDRILVGLDVIARRVNATAAAATAAITFAIGCKDPRVKSGVDFVAFFVRARTCAR